MSFHSEFDFTYVIWILISICLRFILNLIFFWFETVTTTLEDSLMSRLGTGHKKRSSEAEAFFTRI